MVSMLFVPCDIPTLVPCISCDDLDGRRCVVGADRALIAQVVTIVWKLAHIRVQVSLHFDLSHTNFLQT